MQGSSSSVEMGMSSIVNLLANISMQTTAGNKILDGINKKFDSFEKLVSTSISNISNINKITEPPKKDNTTLFIAHTNILRNNILESSKNILISINSNVRDLVNSLIQKDDNVTKEDGLSDNEVFKTVDKHLDNILRKKGSNTVTIVNEVDNVLMDNMATLNVNQSIGNKILSNIQTILWRVYKLLPKLAPNPEEVSKDQKVESTKSGIIDIAKAVQLLRAHLTKKMIENFRDFTKALNEFVDIDTKKITTIKVSLFSLSTFFGIIAKKTDEIKKSFIGLTIAIVLMSFALISPMFVLGAGVLVGIIYGIRKAMGSKMMMGWNLKKLGMGILFLVGAIFLMGKVGWEAIGKFLLFLGGLGVVMHIFSGKENVEIKGMFSLGVGMIAMTLAMILMENVSWASLGKMLVFIAGLGIVLRLVNGNGKGQKGMTGMFGFGVGMMAMTLALLMFSGIEVATLLKMVGFILALGIVLRIVNAPVKGLGKAKGMSGMISFGFGMILMTVSLMMFADVPIVSLVKMVGFVLGLGLALKLAGNNKMGLVSLSIGIAILTATLFWFQELSVETLVTFVGFLTGLGLALKLISMKAGLAMLVVSVGVLIITFALSIFKASNVTIGDALTFVGIVTLIAGLTLLLGSTAGLIILGSVTMLVLSASVLATGFILSVVSNLPISVKGIGLLVAGMSLLAVGFAAISPVAVLGMIGALLFLPIAITALIISFTLSTLSNLDIDMMKMLNLTGAMMLLGTTMALLTPISILGMIGAVAFLPIALTSILIGVAMMEISNLTFENVGAFLSAITGLALGFCAITPFAILGLIGATAFMPIALSALWTAAVLGSITKLEIDQSKLENFGGGMHAILDIFNDFGVMELMKGAAKGVLLLPIMASMMASAVILKMIDGLNVKEDRIVGFGNLISKFTTAIVTSLAENEEAFSKAEPGIKALGQLCSIGGDLARTIQLMANMEFYEHEVKDGKLVLKNVRKLTEADFARVGVNMAKMLSTLIDPLTILGSNEDTMKIGGMEIDNPFKSSRTKRGIEMLGQLGMAFKPLVEAITQFASLSVTSDPKALSGFKTGLKTIVETLTQTFVQLESWENDNAETSIENLSKFVDSLEQLNTVDSANIKSIGDTMTNFLDMLSAEDKWVKINKNLSTLSGHFKDISENINNINTIKLEKALTFEKNVNQASENKTEKGIDALITKIEEFIQTVNPTQQTSEGGTGESKTSQIVNNVKESGGTLEDALGNLSQLMGQVVDGIATTNQKLQGKLKVQTIGGPANSLTN